MVSGCLAIAFPVLMKKKYLNNTYEAKGIVINNRLFLENEYNEYAIKNAVVLNINKGEVNSGV